MSFLSKIITDLLARHSDLTNTAIILPGKRPVVFIKNILKDKKYQGILPEFYTAEEMVMKISECQIVKGISLWLFAYDIYRKLFPEETLDNFLKWFPTLLKDWDDMLKFSESDKGVLEYMFDDERIKNWGETLGEGETPRKRNLNFWRKMNVFLPILKKELKAKSWATDGMAHEMARENLPKFIKNTATHFVFCGFNALTPLEKKLMKGLLQEGKAECFFQADKYYLNDQKQEAGKFLREHKQWKEFNENRPFHWVENQFVKPKNINVYEVSGNITQTKILPQILQSLEEKDFSKTAVVLLDEELLPATLDAMSFVQKLNITMGFPIKNLSFSNAIKKLFHLYKQLQKKDSTYYYSDIFPVLEELPKRNKDEYIINQFITEIEQRNIVYISKNYLKEKLGELSYFHLLEKKSVHILLDELADFCYQLKFSNLDDIQCENITHFEKTFKILKNHFKDYDFEISIEVLEVLINQLVNLESVDFQGEPLEGLQLMGLLETRLLDFKNIIMLSVNEGKLPLGNSQNTYLPFDVRMNFGLNTFLENDSIYAYHFYRLIQGAKNVHLLYNALSSGVNTGEKSRFITQIEMESPHKIEHIVVENTSEPILQEPIKIEKTAKVLEKLEEWKKKISASHLTTYLYNPIDFYLNNVLKVRDSEGIEEELSQRNYGNLVHHALQYLYEKVRGKMLLYSDLISLKSEVDDAINFAIQELKHQPELYDRGMNYIHKSIATKVVHQVLDYDLELIDAGDSLEIIDLERNIKSKFILNNGEEINFNGFVDRIDRLNGVLRIIDYKTAKPTKLNIKPKEEKLADFLKDSNHKQALQLAIYAYSVLSSEAFPNHSLQCGIWSFAEVNSGVQTLKIYEDLELNRENVKVCMQSIENIILEILNPEIPFTETK
ncbi:MAG: PD-(D/E)XK nuclease family protein [Flavobacteriaceae bacterium]|nr:PD-(D/E)XK nuclease family protein [Flavobacteriaceae bacterium]